MLPFISVANFEKTTIEKADSCFNANNYEKAVEYYNEAIVQIDKSSIEERSEIYIRLGYIYKILENFDDALLVYEKLMAVVKKIKNSDLSIRIKVGYAELLRSLNECQKSKEIIDGIKIDEFISDLKLTTIASYYDRYAAIINQCFGDLEESLVFSEKALVYARKSKSNYHIATSLNEMGYIYEHIRSANAAIPYYEEALKLWGEERFGRYSSNACLNLSRCYNKEKKVELSLFYADKGLKIVGTHNWFRVLVPLYSEKISCLIQSGRWKEAYEVSGLYHDAAISMRSQEWSNKVASVKGELELERKESELLNERTKFEHAETIIEKEREIRRSLIYIIIIVLLLTLVALFFYVKLKRLNSKLKNTLSENDVLLKEVHHRVKNNMQVVSSLLDLQSSFAIDEKSKNALTDSRDRINSLALAHQNLYIEDDLKSINVKNYLEVLIHSVVSREIILNVHIEEGNLEIEKAQALGFVLNELLTNSIKHAWKNLDDEKVIWIKLLRNENEWSFFYSDNGVGVDDKAKFLDSSTFGITLIRSFLKRNLKGSITFGEKPGMNIGFKFK